MSQVVAQPHGSALGMSAGPGVSKNETGDICMQTSIALPFRLEKGQSLWALGSDSHQLIAMKN